jgi:hypothetical protein
MKAFLNFNHETHETHEKNSEFRVFRVFRGKVFWVNARAAFSADIGAPCHMANSLLLVLAFLIQAGSSTPAAGTKPLPDLDSFLKGIRKNLHSNQIIQSQYTFAEKVIRKQVDGKGNVKETETRIYEVYPSADEQFTYRKLISKNDKPVSNEESEKSARDFDKRRLEWRQKLESESAEQKQKRESKELEAKHKDEEAAEEAFRLFNISMIGREYMDGIPVIGFSFSPRSDFKPKTQGGKILLKVRGKAWFSEEDQELVRVEAELIDNLSFGLGVIAKLNQGSHLYFQRRRINNEVWLPASSHFVGTGRILLLKGFRIDQETIYSDYCKFSVETDWQVTKPDK